jgi:hypothetical protein
MVELNIHGYPKTNGFNSYDEWISYAIKKLNLVKDRMTIKEFLQRDQFLKTNRDNNGPEPKSVIDFKKDPYPKNGLPKKSSDYTNKINQRREFGFRENILQGYPNYTPDRIGWGETNSKVIAGFVTVGDGIFSGIPPHHDISLNILETRRQSEYGYGRSTGKQMTPSGLCFIQDETSAVGIHVGSDVRFLWHPKMYGNYLANSSVSIDQMHTGATLVPKGDYRQFLRVGDFVIVEIGIRLNYWNSLLGGNELYNWESLIGYGEVYDRVPFIDVYGVNVSEEIISKVAPNEYTYSPPLDNKGRNLQKKTINTPPDSFTETKDVPVEEGVRNVIDHAWSTGTPVPVNTGMPFVMTEDFAIDSTDRRNPFPKEIQVENIRDLKGDGTNNGSLLKGQLVKLKNLRIVVPPKRWTLLQQEALDSSGKPLKGGIHSSTIDLTAPVLSRQVEPLTDSEFEDEYYEPPSPRPEHLWFNDESHEYWLPRGVNFLFDLPEELVTRYFPDTNVNRYNFNATYGLDRNTQVTSSNYFNVKNQNGERIFKKFPKNLPNDYKYWTHTYHNVFGVDPSNIKIEMFSFSKRKGPKGLPDSLEWSTPPQNLDESKKLELAGGGYFSALNFTNDEGWAMRSDESNPSLDKQFYIPNGARYTLRKEDKSGNITYNLGITLLETDFFQFILKPVLQASAAAVDLTIGVPIFSALIGLTWATGGDYTGAGAADFWDIFELEIDKITENSWPDKIADYSRMGMPYYKYGLIPQPFPISIDKLDGDYWFTDPNIPKSIVTPSDGKIIDRKVGDISRHDPNNPQERQALTNYINRYENYKGESPIWRNRHPIDYGYRLYSDVVIQEKLDPSKVQFLPNKVYYAADENGFVIPIRINANTEIARYRVPVPTGVFDITGIAWQYSMGQPGLEWEREGYIMQIWPRFLSDINSKIQQRVKEDDKRVEGGGKKPDIVTPTPPTRIPDITINLGDAIPLTNINSLDCDRIKYFIEGNNSFIKKMNLNDPIQGCDGLKPGQEMYIIVESDIWYGVSRTFYFRKDKDGNCTCLLVPKGTNLKTSNGV